MIVIYAEKYSLGRTIAEALGAYKKTVNPKESSIAHWDLNLNGEQAILCHGAGHLCGLAPAEDYDERYKIIKLSVSMSKRDKTSRRNITPMRHCLQQWSLPEIISQTSRHGAI